MITLNALFLRQWQGALKIAFLRHCLQSELNEHTTGQQYPRGLIISGGQALVKIVSAHG